jgi:predicted phosphodiesterase
MKFIDKEKLNRFLFPESFTILPRVLLSIYLVLAIAVSSFIYINPPQFKESEEDILVNREEVSLENQVPGEESQSTGTSKKSSSQSTGTANSGSQPDPASSDSSGEDTSVSLVAFYADSQSDTDEEDQNHQRVVDAILATSANPIFHAGDLLEDGTEASRDRFNLVTNILRATRTFYAAQGNNERNSSVYFDNFTFPGNEHYYSVNSGNLHMIVLDNYALSVAVGSAQYNWLLSDLQSEASQSKITGVIFHYPIYGGGGDYKGMIGSMVPLFRNYGVDFVVSGHEHSYQKAQVDGIWYFVTSGQPSIGYFLGYIYSDRVTMKVYNNSNSQIDSTTFSER